MTRLLVSDCLDDWQIRWPNFAPTEPGIGCGGCTADSPCRNNRLSIDALAMDKLQALRNEWGGPLRVNSSYRCPFHNAAVGGAARSRHKEGDAFDVSVRGMNEQKRARLFDLARSVGFTGFGFYTTFLHVDTGRPRTWVVGNGRVTWNFLLTS